MSTSSSDGMNDLPNLLIYLNLRCRRSFVVGIRTRCDMGLQL